MTPRIKLLLLMIALMLPGYSMAIDWRCAAGNFEEIQGWPTIEEIIEAGEWPEDWEEWFKGIDHREPPADKTCEHVLENLSEDQIQIVVFPVGFESGYGDLTGRDVFYQKVNEMRIGMSEFAGDDSDTFTSTHRDRFVYIAVWVEGGEVGSDQAQFNGRLEQYSDKRLLADDDLVFSQIEEIKAINSNFDPANAIVMFEAYGRANANLPNRHQNAGIGISRVDEWTSYRVVTHELGHSFMGWQDEYLEPIRLSATSDLMIDIKALDWLAFLGLWQLNDSDVSLPLSSFLNIYDINFSEIYASASDNLSSYECPTKVGDSDDCGVSENDPDYDYFPEEGSGPFNGLFKQTPNSLMGSNGNQSALQDRAVETAMTGQPRRPNNRIHNAGPLGFIDVASADGANLNLTLLGYDEDKHHTWQPTIGYEVEIAYEETYLTTCRILGVSFPCTKYRPASPISYPYEPSLEVIQYDGSALEVIVDLGRNLPGEAGQVFNLLGEVANGVNMPYQRFEVSVPKDGRNYKWRFRTLNKGSFNNCTETSCSEWTEPSYFYNF